MVLPVLQSDSDDQCDYPHHHWQQSSPPQANEMHASDGFSSANLLGEGGFGQVRKGNLSNGKEVAVKQLKIGSGQGKRDFQSEDDTVSHIHHKNLVSLVGYYSTDDLRLLVYDYVPNKTLDLYLHGTRGKPLPSNWAPLNWATRIKVALGSAKGLAYLHEVCQPKIIHRDILLDNSFEAKSRPLLSQAICDADFGTLVDARLQKNYDFTEMSRMVTCAAACVRHLARLRPKMSEPSPSSSERLRV
ncbi:proline-rich receptor-like protein kinase PERK1 [Daucus carota subsp. sativus]|uniref:proline-rich receptor-like protein kinase PERK1 n=1 Tax=Daucus carota subsp. sativus TaxID=79200 RepID=UPI003083CEB8